MPGPNSSLAIARYRRLAANYDNATRRAAPVRARAVAALELRGGDTVLDVACGTGASFPLLQEKIGASGRIIGVDVSQDMLALAQRRVEAARWTNVMLIRAAMESVQLPIRWDAALFHYTQDVLRSRDALANIFLQATDGARVAAAGTKLFPRWLAPLNVYVWAVNRSYMTTFDGLSRPWSLLQRDYIPDLRVEPVWLGASYIARGCYRGSRASEGRSD